MSNLWEFYEVFKQEPHKVRCTLCYQIISRGGPNADKKTFSTINLNRHLKRIHHVRFNGHITEERSIEKQENVQFNRHIKKERSIEKQKIETKVNCIFIYQRLFIDIYHFYPKILISG